MKDHDEKENRLPKVITRAGGMITAGFGALALIGWVLGFPLLASLGKWWKPMSPSTAPLFVLYGTTLFLNSPKPRATGRTGYAWLSVQQACWSLSCGNAPGK